MALPGRRLVVGWFAVLVAAWTVLAVLSGADTGLLYLAPALLLCAPLIFGRYVGEEQLAELAKRLPGPPRGRLAPARSRAATCG